MLYNVPRIRTVGLSGFETARKSFQRIILTITAGSLPHTRSLVLHVYVEAAFPPSSDIHSHLAADTSHFKLTSLPPPGHYSSFHLFGILPLFAVAAHTHHGVFGQDCNMQSKPSQYAPTQQRDQVLTFLQHVLDWVLYKQPCT